MPADRGFGLRAFASNFRFQAESPQAFDILDRFVFPSLPRVEAGAVEPDVTLSVVQAGEGFELRLNGAAVASAQHASGLVPHLIHTLDETVIQRLRGLHALHAGAVQWCGKALILPGSTHSGKSSLVAELIRRGAAYASDEYALLGADGLVHPYPRPLLLRNENGEQSPAAAEELNGKTAGTAAPLGWVFAVGYDAGGQWSVEEVPQSVALLALLRNTPHAMADSPEMLPAFERALAGAVCYAGRRGDAAAAAARILELAGGTG
jgi:hypothetical protein